MSKQKVSKKDKDQISENERPVDAAIKLDKSNNILISILAKPGAKQNAITDISSEGIGIQINAPPTEGAANTELIKYISRVVGVRKGDVFLEKGFKSRQKTVKIINNAINLETIKCKIVDEMNE